MRFTSVLGMLENFIPLKKYKGTLKLIIEIFQVNKEWKINVANGSQCKRKHKKEIVREKIKECTKKIKTKSKSEDLLKNRFVIEKQRLKLEKASGILSVTTV